MSDRPAASARQIAFHVLRRVDEGGAYASRALDAALAQAGALDPREAGLATELVYGTLRRALTLDAALTPHASRPIAQADPAARIALRIAAYELLFLGTAPHAAVGEAVGLTKQVDHGRASGFVNAVLRALARKPERPVPPPIETDPAGHVAIAEALPRWLAEEWVAWLGAGEALALAAAMNAPAPLTLRSERRDDLVARLRAAGIDATPASLSPDGVRIGSGGVAAVARGASGIPFQVQDEAAQLVTLLAAWELRGKPARVLDACAAPGGKAFHLAELLAPGSEIVAVEIHPRKADALREEAFKRVLPGVKVICADASKPIPGLAEGSFDAVLVDAPCAGLGTLRRHPELKLRRVAEDLPRFAAMQEPILRNCARYAKPGAPIVYSICSLSRDEGPRLVEGMLASGFARAPAPAGFPAEVLTADGDLLTLPSRHGTDGFFAARLVRPAPLEPTSA